MSTRNLLLWVKTLLNLGTATLLTLVTITVAAQNNINDLAVVKGTAGRTVIKLTTKDPLANPPAAFTINNPPRIALDFPDTTNNLGKSLYEVGDATLRNVNVVQAGGRTRIVLNLTKQQGFETQIEGNTLLITLFDQALPTQAAQAGTTVVSRFAEAKDSITMHSMRDLDFRRGKNGEGRIVVELSDSGTGIDIRQQGRTLVVDFLKTSLPRNLERRLDVVDFATPVVLIDTFAQGDNTRMVMEPKCLWEHSAYQTDNRFILEIKPLIEDPNKLTQGSRPGYKGEKLSLNFQNVEVRSVLAVIADFTGLNIITSDTVTGNLTLRLKDVPWDQALDIIMQTKGLDMRKNGNVVLIAPREEIAVKEEQELKARQQLSDLEPLQTEVFQLNYQKAESMQKLLTDKDQRILSKRGSAAIDPRTNTIFVQDTGSRLEEVRRVINRVDVTVRQVLIETRIVIADDKFSKRLGSRFGQQTGFTVGDRYSVGSGGALTGRGPVISGTAGQRVRETRTQTPYELASGLASTGYGDDPQLNVNLPVSGAAGQLALTIINLGSGNIVNLELSALEANNQGKVISSPRVITSDNQKAVIEQGTEIPFITPGGVTGAPTVAFKKAVLSLAVTPQITPDNKIIMTLEIRKDSVGQIVSVGQGVSVPSIDTRNVITQIALNNGDTAVIGGIYEENVRTDVSKVPLLGDIPVVGHLFKTTSKQQDKTELLIFITPRIVKDNLADIR